MNQPIQYTPQQVVWELTLKCNLRCMHCGSSAGKPRPNELTLNESLTLCSDLAKLNTQTVCLMGGEPFLSPHWQHISKTINELGMNLQIITNSYIINAHLIKTLTTLQPYAVATSLDGATAQTHDRIRGVNGSFDKVMQFLTLTEEAHLPTTVITTVNKFNFSELPQLKDLLVNKNIAWQLQIAAPEGRFSTDYALTKNQYYATGLFIAHLQKKFSKKELPVIGAHCFGYHSQHLPSLGLYKTWNGCQAGKSILSIKSNGDITGCLSIPDTYIEGNIRNKSIIDIWNDTSAFSYNRTCSKNDLGPNCADCPHGTSCKGGCMGMSTAFTDRPHNDPYCFYKIEAHQSQQKGGNTTLA